MSGVGTGLGHARQEGYRIVVYHVVLGEPVRTDTAAWGFRRAKVFFNQAHRLVVYEPRGRRP